ncbi:MAG TPA: hypothetical protein VEC01_06810, partial [Noviherbaspirillum sp.]|uniref:hypothetical protein n=1 Tax=Noviherbaspirillum sp. TaxID=1926288 RepID=UPI002D31956E
MKTRTPPDIKWLLVERATLLGDIARLQERQSLIGQAIAKLEAKIRAFDVTISLATADAPVQTVRKVRAFPLEYKKRGALKEFIVATLMTKFPESI